MLFHYRACSDSTYRVLRQLTQNGTLLSFYPGVLFNGVVGLASDGAVRHGVGLFKIGRFSKKNSHSILQGGYVVSEAGICNVKQVRFDCYLSSSSIGAV